MTTTPEGSVKQKIRDVFKSHRIHFLHIPGSAYGRGGAPDYVACVNGMYLEVEAKSKLSKGKGKQTKLQEDEEEKCFRSGGVYIVVNEDRIEALSRLIESLKDIGVGVDTIKIEEAFKS